MELRAVILKKPYAFLIKKFRLIHLILTGLIGYLLFRTYNLYDFFSRYVTNVYATMGDAIPSNYITVFMFLVSIIIIVFSLAMYLLMRKKDKPKNLYIALSTYYILYFIGLILYFVLFKSMESAQLTIRNAMVIRDLTLIIMFPQIILLVLSLIRGIGFDIKKFNFSKDLKELDIAEEDNEEFEFILGVDSYKYFRYARRRLREFKYYILENKFMFTILASLTCSILLIITILNFTVYNRTYGKNQKIHANNLTLEIKNSYITDVDYKGETISDGKYFLVIDIDFTNDSGSSTVLDLQNYYLDAKSGRIYPTLTRNTHFIDFGPGYSKEKLENGKTANYILIYEFEEKDLANKYTFKITDEIEYKAGTMNAKEKKVSLTPLSYIEIEDKGTYKPTELINMYGTILEDTSFIANSFEFTNKVTYKYEACIRTNCKTVTDVVTADVGKSKKLLVLKGNLNLDNGSSFARNGKTKMSFFEAFVEIKYDDKIAQVIDATPKSISEQYILQVDEESADAKKVELIFTIRNKKYTLKLK